MSRRSTAIKVPGSPDRLHFAVVYPDRRKNDTGRYAVCAVESIVENHVEIGGVRRQFQAKSAAIAEAQGLNGYQPVDGSETTYATQLEMDLKMAQQSRTTR